MTTLKNRHLGGTDKESIMKGLIYSGVFAPASIVSAALAEVQARQVVGVCIAVLVFCTLYLWVRSTSGQRAR